MVVLPHGKMPTRGTSDSAGLDLYSSVNVEIRPYSMEKITSGIEIGIPQGYYGQIADKSSIAVQGLKIMGGVIDADYRGEVIVMLMNLTHKSKIFKVGDLVAQLILQPYLVCSLEQTTHLPKTRRGFGGFGSTFGKQPFFEFSRADKPFARTEPVFPGPFRGPFGDPEARYFGTKVLFGAGQSEPSGSGVFGAGMLTTVQNDESTPLFGAGNPDIEKEENMSEK